MDVCEIIIVEDDEDTRESWKRDIFDFNNNHQRPFDINATFAETRIDAIRKIRLLKIQAAIVDLRIPDGQADKPGGGALGNDVLQHLLLDAGIPTYVYSGYHQEASDQVLASNIKIVEKKGGATRQILKELASQSDLMYAMSATRETIAKETSKLFNNSIWRRWENRWSSFGDRETIAGIISRQTAAHISESLAGSPVKLHPDEFYVVPGVNMERLDTGDLVLLNELTYVVLTPRCNMANKVPSHILLALCVNVTKWPSWKDQLQNGNREKRERAEREIRDHATQGHEIATHFLPPLDGMGPWLVSFQEARTFPEADFPKLLKGRFASVAPQFVPNLVQRYSSYLGRIGQPDIGTDILMGLCIKQA